jgi:molybdopterin converting factor subunit 1
VLVTVLLFASIAEAAGTRRVEVPWQNGDTVAAVRDRVISAYPHLERFIPNLMYAVDETYAETDDPVPAGATVAFIPPVSGGQ